MQNQSHLTNKLFSLNRIKIRVLSSRWTIPFLLSVPYFGSVAWLIYKGQTWIGILMFSPALMMALLLGLTALLAQIEFRGRWRG